MKYYAHFGFDDFMIALGYKGEAIKGGWSITASLAADLTVHLRHGAIERHDAEAEDWRVSLIDTGLPTATGGAHPRLAILAGDGTFMLTWATASTVDLHALLDFHRSHGKLVTLTRGAAAGPVRPRGDRRDFVVEFSEALIGEGWINGAFFVCSEGLRLHRRRRHPVREGAAREPRQGRRAGRRRHHDFGGAWTPCAHRKLLQELWDGGEPPWKVWA